MTHIQEFDEYLWRKYGQNFDTLVDGMSPITMKNTFMDFLSIALSDQQAEFNKTLNSGKLMYEIGWKTAIEENKKAITHSREYCQCYEKNIMQFDNLKKK